jgi:hypothetical protein
MRIFSESKHYMRVFFEWQMLHRGRPPGMLKWKSVVPRTPAGVEGALSVTLATPVSGSFELQGG